ncbi:unnamed protein product [Vitrella brassicaformis CCMP3155]|uniref:Uncharacterized protein n=1 Tax=Vitrella brassicaformis (strain CCMP3155) TaxID=1169540 RepID=A0A0G4GCP5_VITBC|nr:unnamed protein product [Vitrella brassicaformis CCMP3155]|eukprot:CEM27042.1 unnamed protein product [Vitrella brassicaformis CCMP3155]
MKDLPHALHVPTDDKQVDNGAAAGPPQKKQKTEGTMVHSGLLHLLAMCEYFGMDKHVAAILAALYSCIPKWSLDVTAFILELKPNLLASADFPRAELSDSLSTLLVRQTHTYSGFSKDSLKRLPLDLIVDVVGRLALRYR